MIDIFTSLFGLSAEQAQAISVIISYFAGYVPNIGSGLYLLAMYGVFFDKPKIIEKSEKISKLWDVLQANAGKAKNVAK